MPLLDVNASTPARKRQLAQLVALQLRELGHEAEVVEGNRNLSGHRDIVIVRSSLGLVHTTASNNTDPNSSILVSDIADGSQAFLEGKTWIAYGWVDRGGRTLVQVVTAEHVMGRRKIPKTEVVRLADKNLSRTYPA